MVVDMKSPVRVITTVPPCDLFVIDGRHPNGGTANI